VYQQTQRWLKAGCFEAMVHDLRLALRVLGGREPAPSAAILDSRVLSSTPESGARAGYNGHKKVKGSKVHIAVDTLGHLLAPKVTAANADDRTQVAALSEELQEATGKNVEIAFVDQGYSGADVAEQAQRHSIELCVVKLEEAKRGLFSYPAAGLSNVVLPGPPASGVWSRTMSGFRRLALACASWLSPVLCSNSAMSSS
jgi:transposase